MSEKIVSPSPRYARFWEDSVKSMTSGCDSIIDDGCPLTRVRFWEEMSVKYAEQLENSKECLKASSVLLACHKVRPQTVSVTTDCLRDYRLSP